MERGNSLTAGWRALSHGKLILLLAATTALLGVLGALPIMPGLRSAMGGTLAGDHLIRNHPTFAPTDFADVLLQQEYAILGMRRAALGVGLLGFLLQVFFAGGIIAVLGRGPFTFGQFLEPARRNAWHNVKCLGLFAVSAGLVLGAWFAGEGAATKKLFENLPPDATIRSVERWGSIVIEVLLFAALSLLYDFARAARRYSPAIGAVRGYRFAWRALSGSWTRGLVLFLFWLIAGGVVVLALLSAAWMMPSVSAPAVGLLFLLQFAVLWGRSAARVATWGSYLRFLDGRARKALTQMARPRTRTAPAASSAF